MKNQKEIAIEHGAFIKSFKFRDGTIWETCKAPGCSFATPRERGYSCKHSNDGFVEPIVDDDSEELLAALTARLELLAPKPEPEAGAEEESDWDDDTDEAECTDEASDSEDLDSEEAA